MATAVNLLILAVVFILCLYIVEALPKMMREIFAAIGFIVVGLWVFGKFNTDVIVLPLTILKP